MTPPCYSMEDHHDQSRHVWNYDTRSPQGSAKPGARVRSKSVSFYPKVVVRYSKYLPQSCWYDKTEFEQIQQDAAVTARLLSVGMLTEDTEMYCLRGIEVQTPKGHQRRMQQRKAAMDAVLDEQDFQREIRGGICDPDLLARVYRPYSVQCASVARKLALMDEGEALK